MKKNIVLSLAALVTVVVLLGWQVPQTAAEQPKTLEFNSMVGVPPALTGTQNPIRGINGGGLPWTIGPSSGELKSDGRLEVQVQGLVFAAGPNTGSNTVPAFRAIVSCLKSDGTVQNVMTAPFPATLGPASQGGGNAEIEATLTLPHPCIAPLIFVTSPGGSWFATIGS